jgi:hypothetical protein
MKTVASRLRQSAKVSGATSTQDIVQETQLLSRILEDAKLHPSQIPEQLQLSYSARLLKTAGAAR